MKKIKIILITLVLVGLLLLLGYFLIPEQILEKSFECESQGGIWVKEQIGGYIDLNVNIDNQCNKWGGNCGPRIISSFIIGKCSNGEDCWLSDIWEPTCLLPK